MDHRWYERTNMRLTVAIHDASIGLIIGRTRDISREGMFVELPNVVLDDDLVTLSLTSPQKGASPVTDVLAQVVYRTDKGVGLWLTNYRFKAGFLAPVSQSLSS